MRCINYIETGIYLRECGTRTKRQTDMQTEIINLFKYAEKCLKYAYMDYKLGEKMQLQRETSKCI